MQEAECLGAHMRGPYGTGGYCTRPQNRVGHRKDKQQVRKLALPRADSFHPRWVRVYWHRRRAHVLVDEDRGV